MFKRIASRSAMVFLCLGILIFGAAEFPVAAPVLTNIKSVWYLGWDKSSYESPSMASELATLKRRLNINTVGLIVPLFQDSIYDTNPHRDASRTPTNAQVLRVIQQAHALGLQVILLPYLISDDEKWVGLMEPEDISQWFRRWQVLLGQYAEFAQAARVEIFLIGWEFETLYGEIEAWETTIAQVRKRYTGLVSYIANFWANGDEYQRVLDWTPWEELDFIGVSAYFELMRKPSPTVQELREAWHSDANQQDVLQNLKELSQSYGRCIAFWELGYASKEGATQYPWDFAREGSPDQEEQSNAFLAAFQVLGNESWMAGYSIWSQDFGLGLTLTGYDVLEKLAEVTVRSHELSPRRCDDAR